MMPSPYKARATLPLGLSFTVCVAAACVQHHELLVGDGIAGADAGASMDTGISSGSGGQGGDHNEAAVSTGGASGAAGEVDGGQRVDASSYTSYCPAEQPVAGASCADAGVRIFGGIIPCDYPNGDRCLCGLLSDQSWQCINGRATCLLEHVPGDVCYFAGESCSNDERTCTCQSQEGGREYVWYCR